MNLLVSMTLIGKWGLTNRRTDFSYFFHNRCFLVGPMTRLKPRSAQGSDAHLLIISNLEVFVKSPISTDTRGPLVTPRKTNLCFLSFHFLVSLRPLVNSNRCEASGQRILSRKLVRRL